jgi:hypothetical protein
LEEDEKLREAVKKFGTHRWLYCADYVQTISLTQCRDRWVNHIDSTLNKSQFEEWEDELIVNQHELYGNY